MKLYRQLDFIIHLRGCYCFPAGDSTLGYTGHQPSEVSSPQFWQHYKHK